MFPAAGLKLEAVVVAEDAHLRLAGSWFEDSADAGDGDVVDGTGDFSGRGGGEEKLVVFTPVEESIDLGSVIELGGEGMEGKRGKVEFGGDIGGRAEVSEIGGEAVAEINAGGREAAAKEGLADGEARLGEEMRVIIRGGGGAEFARGGGERCELGCSSSEGSGDVEEVAGAGSGAAEGSAGGSGAEEDDVGEDVVCRGLRGVSSSERDVVRGGKCEEAVEEAIEPARIARYGFWHGEGEEGREWLGSHGGKVAEASGEGPMADGGGSVPDATEVAVFEGEVCGDEEFVAWGRFDDGAIVADTQENCTGAGCASADSVDNRQFPEGILCMARVGRI